MEHKENLQALRHSLAHLLGAAVLELYPGTKNTIGPAVDNGFYYDFDLSSPVSEKDFVSIENKMRQILKTWKGFSCTPVSVEDARAHFKDNPYKLELIEDIATKGEQITLYTSGDFTDLCRGGHTEDIRALQSAVWKLTRVAGAYWRGNEKNKMLTRIYGLAFSTKEDLESYEKAEAEAEKRDHRKLGKELGLFVFSDIVGKGLPLWTPKGATIRRVLERFIVDEEIKRGYEHVCTPDIAKIDLYKKSGHYPYYKDSMYAPIKIDEEEFMLRPMTCPHHFELYLSKPRSYKELPMRIAELAQLYRYEQSGELSGLVRVRSFCLADAHIICKDDEQAGEEVARALDLIEHIASVFGLTQGVDYSYRLSLGDRANTEKYFKDDVAWDKAELILRNLLKKRGSAFVEASAEAAFYGPKIDIQMKDVRGKENTAFTVQYDFVMPKRFNLSFTDADGKEKLATVIHRSSIGAIERVFAFLLEKYAGNFPFWLAPVQVRVLPVRESHSEHAKKIFETLRAKNFRVEIDATDDGLGKKVRAAKVEKTPYWIVIGDKEVESGMYVLEDKEGKKSEPLSLEKIVETLLNF